ncbi:helicase-related protein [Gordonia neofelifaecis]|uniref:Helicase domain-containing protein n=1 Tax=Gordonia neofelifaecis NRRL B-59395 TaxID=644548 RepID=F1YMK7_9ACTN|nr:helicase-related protein [Gordonia neofelifaecis]EGD53942.1 helicase domain-containing protein [Gordonia neofelifaecis NRRL B-59395]
MILGSLSDLRPGQRLSGRWREPVQLVAVTPNGTAATVVVRDDRLGVREEMLFADDVASIVVEEDFERSWTFDADPRAFRLATEALRISMTGAHDPMAAVGTSDISPLPHQIRAVYGELLPRTPLRFLLADDPGAGKTVMAGLYAKELLLRGDLARMLIVAPGGLVEQWQDELAVKFGITATLLTRELINASPNGDPFPAHPLMIARMDQLARDPDLVAHLEVSEWDLVVVDEAHRMSASWQGWDGEVRETERFKLGRVLGGVARNLLLMTATPHAGNDDNFQLFLSLLDEDRFAGRPQSDAVADTSGLMRRMVKEELLTFEGRPLFPERIAETVPYELSDGEAELYEAVTQYVRVEMNRAQSSPDSPKRRTVGFALTVLQRRLASSTHAVLRSLQRRRDRLASRRADLIAGRIPVDDRTPLPPADAFDDPDEYSAEEYERIEEEVVDAATAARTVVELDTEIAILEDLVGLATRVRDRGIDRKWSELRGLLTDRKLLRDKSGRPRKLIVFTEHKDTLDYLTAQIRNVLGSDDAVLTIHGGTRRADRVAIREQFTNEPDRLVLVATDAAGEGLNLQAAHLMVNYDLPWNPNRLEQRFGRIHRIGQKNVCRLWNIVAAETREGQVYTRLLAKMEQQRAAYGGKLFDVLGDEAFAGRPLRDLLWDAVLYGDDPARIDEIERIVDAEVASGCDTLITERALARETLDPIEMDRLRRAMDEATARRLQPHYIAQFFADAFATYGGRLAKRERHRFQITNVPAPLRHRDIRREHAGRPVTRSYERVTFEPAAVSSGPVRAELLAPGHPLLDAVIDSVLDGSAAGLAAGATLLDPTDSGTRPRAVFAVTSEVVDGTGAVVDKRFAFVSVAADGTISDAGPAPHLDLRPLPDDARPPGLDSFMAQSLTESALSWAAGSAVPQHLREIRERVVPEVERTEQAVRSRLVEQINYLDSEVARRREETAAGKPSKKRRMSPERLERQARELEARLGRRLRQLADERALTARPPRIVTAMLVVPAGMLAMQADSDAVSRHAVDTTVTDRRAVDAVLRAERDLGRTAEEMPHNNPGYDVLSVPAPSADGGRAPSVYIEVKGRVVGADTFYVSYNQVLQGKNTGENHRLAMVSVSPDGPEHDEVRYLTDYFRDIDLANADVSGVELNWHKAWRKATPPH